MSSQWRLATRARKRRHPTRARDSGRPEASARGALGVTVDDPPLPTNAAGHPSNLLRACESLRTKTFRHDALTSPTRRRIVKRRFNHRPRFSERIFHELSLGKNRQRTPFAPLVWLWARGARCMCRSHDPLGTPEVTHSHPEGVPASKARENKRTMRPGVLWKRTRGRKKNRASLWSNIPACLHPTRGGLRKQMRPCLHSTENEPSASKVAPANPVVRLPPPPPCISGPGRRQCQDDEQCQDEGRASRAPPAVVSKEQRLWAK